jgi:hypothetical protein
VRRPRGLVHVDHDAGPAERHFDTSGYFYNGYFRNHYGSVRSDAGIAKVLAALEGN